MWPSLKIGTVVVAVIGLVMSGLAVAQAIDDPGGSGTGGPAAEQVIGDALAPLVEDGTLTRARVDAVAGELALIVARVQERTKNVIRFSKSAAFELCEWRVSKRPPTSSVSP
ncbi:MAG: hypothetical protein RI637_03110, partial [Acidimicrobiia bacterium]|nr:hypothetical protein [Acidimicrobiia bacterium]